MNRLFTIIVCLNLTLNANGQAPKIKYTGSSSICAGKSLVLSVDGAATGSTFKWRKDAALIIPAETGIAYTATTAGIYDVIVTTAGIHDTLPSVSVTVNPNPVSLFTSSPANQCSNVPVLFNNSSSGVALDYTWGFDDPKSGATNNASEIKNPRHIFVGNPGNATQNFTVSLTVTDNKGCKDISTDVITTKQIPGTQLGGTGATTYNGLPYFTQCTSVASQFTFTNQSTTKLTNTGYQIKWGDASADFAATDFNIITHTYSVGNYKLQFIVSGGNGCKDTSTYNIFVGSNPAVGLGNPGNTVICSGTSLTFPISGTASNPPGTEYSFYFNDGSTTIPFIHPAPPSVTHRFDEGSCGITSANFFNSFEARIVASNPCGVSAASVVPIYVSKKATADFKVSPKDTTCVNSLVTFTNTGINANSVSSLGQCSPGKSVWKITPATGWTVSSGNLGDDFGLADPSVWTPGSTNLGITFTAAGIYTIKLRSGGNSLCGDDEIEKTICVNPIPVAAFNVNQVTGCLPLTVTTVNNSNSPNCGTNTYNWTVSYSNAGGCDPGVADFDYINGTNANSANPQYRFNNPGVYTIRLVTTSTSSNCISAAATREITVKAKPVVSFTLPTSICQNGSINPVASVNNCYSSTTATYAWAFTGATPASSTAINPGNIIYSTAGTYSVSLTITNECGATTVTKQLLVKPTPDVVVPADQLLCTGSPTAAISFTSTTPAATFTWTNSNTSIGLPASGIGNIASFTANNTGTAPIIATITVTPSLNGCSGMAKSFIITVNPKPVPASVSSPSYCQGDVAVPLTAITSAGNTLLWHTTASGGTGSPIAPTPLTTIAGNTNYYVSQVNTASGCESSRALITVTVNPAPKITSSSSVNPTICASSTGSIILNGLTPNTTYTLQYNKNSTPVSVTIASNTNGVITITGLPAGTYSNVLVVLNACPSNEVGPFILADPNPPATPTAGSNSPLCSGATLNLTAGTTTAGTIIYSWNGPNNFSSNDQNPVITTATLAANGDYTITVSLNGCAVSKTISVVVNPKPAKPIVDRPVVYCLNATATALTATAIPGNTLTWFDNKNLTNGTNTPPIPSTATAGTITYYVNQTNAFTCTSDTAAISVTVYPLTSGNLIGTDQTLCTGNTTTPLTGTAILTGGNGTFTYQWQSSTDNGINWTDISSAITDTYSPGTIIATTKYRRIVKSGPCLSEISNVVTITIQGTLSNYDISASQTICEGLKPAPLAGELPAGGSGSFIYQWESSIDNNSWTPIQNTNIQNYQPPVLNTTTYYKRKTTSGSCSAYSSVITITVNPEPVLKAMADLVYCNNSTVPAITFNSIPAANVTYSWVNNNTTIGLVAAGSGNLSTFNSINNMKIPVSGTITVTPTYTTNNVGCPGDPTAFKITVLPSITINPIADEVVCTGSIIPAYTPEHDAGTFTGSAVRYSWTVNGSSITLTSGSGNQIPAFNAINTGSTDIVATISVIPEYSFNGLTCDGLPETYTITVKSGVSNNLITADQDICVNTSAATLQGTAPAGGNGGFAYQWQNSSDGGNTWLNIIGANLASYDPGVIAGTTLFRRIVTADLCNGSGSSISNNVTITVNQDARALFTSIKDTGCAPFALDPSVISLQMFPQNNIYNWYANGNLIGTGASFPGYTINNPRDSVTIKLVALSGHGCKPDSIEHRFYTYIKPVPSFTISETEGCGPLTVTINNSTAESSLFSYQWDFGNGQISSIAEPGAITFAPNPNFGDTTYIIKLKVISNCEDIEVTRSVRVRSKPKALFAPNSTVGCSPMTVVFNNTSSGIGNSYSWDFGDGTTLATATSESVTHIFTTAIRDTFYVKLKATNECGVDSMNYAIVVSPNAIKLDFAINGTEETGCSPHTVRFINNTKGASNFTWNFGDGNIINTQKNIDTVTHVYQLSGTYTVTLQATNGCSDTTSTEFITVYPTPRAAFDIQANCLADSVRFMNISANASSFQWLFGDGAVSTERNPSHVYSNPGTYTVVLIAYKFNNPGSICTDTVSKLVQLGPTGTFSYTSGFICNNRAAIFQVQTTNTDGFVFNFGDGTREVTNSNSVSHVYINSGSYLPSVTLKNTSGCEIVLTGIDSVKADKINAGFHAVKQQNCGSTVVNFTDTSHAFFGIASRHWDFGDGTTGTGSTINHVYTSGGTFRVELIVTGNSGCADTVRQTINIIVNNIPVAAIQADAISCVGYSIPFTSNVQSIDAINILQWSISNGVTNNNTSFSNVFNQPGNYPVRLIAGTVNGCYDTVIHTIQINPSPTVRASNDVNICLGSNTRLNAMSVSPVNWSPTQGLNCITCTDPVASPIITTPYVVQATNNFGCVGYDTVVVTIIQPLQLAISPDDSICVGQSANLLASGATSYSWSPAVGLNSTGISNPTATPAVTTKYRVVGYDGFNCFTDTAFVLVAVGQYPTITLGSDLVLSTGTLHPLTSVIQNGPISTWSWTPDTDLSCNNCPLPIATIKKEISYTVDIMNNYGCSARDTINIKVFCENTQVFIPNAFTPDNDGINDVFMVHGKGIVMVKFLRVFNRWGELVFEKSSFAPNNPSLGWDGKVKGIAGGPDVFVYTAEVICENGSTYSYKGNVSLIK